MGLISKLFWVALTAVFTFCFVVLFEYGTFNYVENAQHEFENVKALFTTPAKKKPGVDPTR